MDFTYHRLHSLYMTVPILAMTDSDSNINVPILIITEGINTNPGDRRNLFVLSGIHINRSY